MARTFCATLSLRIGTGREIDIDLRGLHLSRCRASGIVVQLQQLIDEADRVAELGVLQHRRGCEGQSAFDCISMHAVVLVVRDKIDASAHLHLNGLAPGVEIRLRISGCNDGAAVGKGMHMALGLDTLSRAVGAEIDDRLVCRALARLIFEPGATSVHDGGLA